MAGGKRKRGGHAAAAGKKQRKKERLALSAKTEAEVEAPVASLSDAQGEQEAPKEETQHEEEDILSAELRAELGGKEGDVLVVVGKKKKVDKKERLPDEVVEQAARLSKTKRKKLEQIAARKVKESRRDELYKSLEQQQLAPQQLELMYSSSRLGHRETLRERLKRSMGRHKAGIALSAEEQQELFQKSTIGEDGGDEDMDESSEGEADAVEMLATGDKSAAPVGAKPSSATKTLTAVAKPTIDAKLNQQQQKSITPAKVDSEDDEQPGDSGGKKRRKKNRSKQAFLASQASSQQQQQATVTADAPPASSTTGSSEVASTTPLTALDQFAPAFRSDGAMEASSSSQSAAMAKLEALRRKNEEKRRQREVARDHPAAKQEEEETVPHEVYVPQPIVLKNADEMRELSKKTKLSYKTTLVQLKRKPEIQLARMQLPVCSSEQEIMEAITENDVVILCGETGSGKTTQVPQFLYEAGYGHPKHPAFHGKVGVTQPRRVAAVSTAKRVAEELNVPFGGGDKGQVGYQIRYDAAHVGPNTRIKFMTDGILLKEIQQDFLLRQYSIVLLDEAHERNVNTDILIGLLSRIAPLRAQMAREEKEARAIGIEGDEPPIQPLKLVIMSATLRVEDFTNNKRLFPNPPPVLRVDARQYPVTVHFNKRTELDDYVSEAFKKVVKIHRKLPEGGVLVFLTGQREISQLCRKLRRAYGSGRRTKKRSTGRPRSNDDSEGATASNEESAASNSSLAVGSDRILLEHDDIEEEADREDKELYGADDADDADDAVYDLKEEEKKSDSDGEDEDEDEDDEMAQPYMHVLPLYSLLPHDEQMKVFDTPPDRHRLIVVATNVAETSLTIPGIKYVVDAGRTKERVFDLASGVSSFEVQWISKASADQRAGRAGRTGPGHCYRLYSSAVYDTEFSKFASPEILRQPIEDLVLQMKAMGIHNVRQFPFPTPPDVQAVRAALATLVNLGAISMLNNEEEITTLGRALVQFPVAARFAKMLLVAREMGLLEYTIAIVAALSGHSPFIHALDRKEQEEADEEMEQMQEGEEEGEKKKKNAKEEDDMEREWREAEAMRRHTQWKHLDSDVLSLLRAAGAYAYTGGSGSFCRENHLHEKTMQNMLKLRQQLTRIVNALYFSDREGITLSPRMPPPDETAQVTLRQIVVAGFLDNVAKRAPAGTVTEGSKIERNCAYLAASSAVNEPVYIHPHSCVFSPDPSRLPAFVVFQHIQRTSRAYLKTVTAVEPAWLAAVGQHTPLCSFSPPLTEPAPFFDVDRDQLRCFARPLFGVHQWALPPMAIDFPSYDKAATTSGNDKTMDKYRWFAKLLLDGDVLPELRALSLSGALKEPSQTLLRKKFDKKIQLLVTKLQGRQVASRRSLAAQWRAEGPKRGGFLQPELRAWVRDSHLATFDAVWTKAVSKALA
jgi:ATP-dependent RNA helicase DHX37/DHR1